MHLANYLGYLHKAELHLADAFRNVSLSHVAESDIYHTCNTLAQQCEAHAGKLGPFVERYGEGAPAKPDRLYHELFGGRRSGGLGLLRDLQDLYLMAHACDISWTMIGPGRPGRSRHGSPRGRRGLRGADCDADEMAEDEDETGGPAGAPGGLVTDGNVHERLVERLGE